MKYLLAVPVVVLLEVLLLIANAADSQTRSERASSQVHNRLNTQASQRPVEKKVRIEVCRVQMKAAIIMINIQ